MLADAMTVFTCKGCGREESVCSADPCAAVMVDREDCNCDEYSWRGEFHASACPIAIKHGLRVPLEVQQ
jgi:hypothetical protein